MRLSLLAAIWFATLVTALPGCVERATAAVPTAAKKGRTLMNEGPLRLTNEEFWTHPHRTREAIEQPFLDADREVLLFDAPREVPLELRQSLPTLGLRVATFATIAQRPFRQTAIVVAVDLLHNEVRAGLAVPPPERERAPARPKPSRPPPEGIGSEIFTIDLRNQLRLDWEPTHLLARLIIWDQATGARPVSLGRTGAGSPEPEEAPSRQPGHDKPQVPPLEPPPGRPLPSYRMDPDSSVPPTEEGIVLSIPRAAERDGSMPCVLRGAFRLPVLRRHILPQEATPSPGDPRPTGVVPITLVATGTEFTGPMVWRLIVPTYDRIDPAAEHPIVTGVFNLDLRKLEGFTQTEQTWFLYAFSDRAMSGPHPVDLTQGPHTPSSLEK